MNKCESHFGKPGWLLFFWGGGEKFGRSEGSSTFVLVTRDVSMILSFGSKETERIWRGVWIKGLPTEIQEIGRRKLRMLNNSQNMSDLRVPPSNRLEKLSGGWKDFYSIRVNDQWRIIFKWDNGNALDVEILNYH
jgi:proteic killer suppression protein